MPVLGYALDRGYRFWCSFYPSQILYHQMHPGEILELRINRPPHFKFRSGDMVFACIPGVSKLEWHPFSISSNPNTREYLRFIFELSNQDGHRK